MAALRRALQRTPLTAAYIRPGTCSHIRQKAPLDALGLCLTHPSESPSPASLSLRLCLTHPRRSKPKPSTAPLHAPGCRRRRPRALPRCPGGADGAPHTLTTRLRLVTKSAHGRRLPTQSLAWTWSHLSRGGGGEQGGKGNDERARAYAQRLWPPLRAARVPSANLSVRLCVCVCTRARLSLARACGCGRAGADVRVRASARCA